MMSDEYNVPCERCGRTDLPLHYDMLCPECKPLIDNVRKLIDFIQAKAEAGRILWEEDAPYLYGLCEEIEADMKE